MRRIAAVPVLLLFLALALPLAGFAAVEDDLYQSALQALRGGDAQTASNLLSQAIAAHPNDHRYYNDRGVAHRVLGNPEKALADYTKAIELKPDYVPALNNRGVLHVQQGTPDKAIADFTEALKYGGLESKVFTNVGWAYAAKEQHKDAVAYFEKALAARPLDPRSFILMAQSLEKIGDTERALKMYQLGIGLLRDTETVERVEQRMAQLERRSGSAGPSARGISAPAARDSSEAPHSAGPAGAKGSQVSARQILPAKPLAQSPAADRTATAPLAETGIDTLESLDARARARAMEKLSPGASEIYRQGSDFLEKSDLSKALVRFEDTLNMERRKKNSHGAAWCSLEIGRVHSRLGDYVKAANYFDIAEKLFRRLKAGDETVLALTEQAAVKKKAGQREHAALAFKQAVESAGSSGHHKLAKLIEDMGAGKMPQRPVVAQRSQPVSSVQKTVERSSAPETREIPRAIAQSAAQRMQPPDQSSAANQKKQVVVAAPKERVPEHARATPTVVKRDAPAKESVTAAPPHSPGREEKSTLPARSIARAESKPQVSVASSPLKPVAIEAEVGTRRGVEVGAALSASPAPEARGVSSTRADSAVEKDIRADLAALRKYRDADDEANMVIVLERLAENYLRRREPKKASHCLATAVIFREKLGLEQGKEKIVRQRGLVREILGDAAGALEDFTWALALSSTKPGSRMGSQLESKSRKLATQMRLDESKALAAYHMLWKARKDGDPQGETEACYTIAGLYEKANKTTEALNYYERSIASILADEARVYRKMGDTARAEETFKLALEKFKTLDYPKYVILMKQLKAAKTLSRE